MAVRKVLLYPHPYLKKAGRPLDLDRERDYLQALLEDLLETMEAHPGCVGLAAPQLGELVRLAVVDVRGHRKTTVCNGRLVLVNPWVVAERGSEVGREGCLSIPSLTANVRRATAITVEAFDEKGAPYTVTSEGFEARAILHELDHLEGILFLDRVDSLARDVFRRKTFAPEQVAPPSGGR